MRQTSRNILLIHENEAQLAEIRAQLIPYFNVFTASSSRPAYKILTEFDMHVVLISEQLRDMTALQFVESIKNEFPDIITLIRAVSDDVSLLKEASRTGKIYQFIRHNANIDDFIQILHSAVSHFELKKDNRSLALELKNQKEEQQKVMELFKRYVPEQVVSQTLLSGENEMMQGETRVVSVLFADIRNFTRLAARLLPSEVVSFLNEFWSMLSEPVKMNHGSVNKLIGDGMLALFGAPVSHIQNQENAVLCALDIIESMKKVNEIYSEQFGGDINIGIGINTGEVVVGNIGTQDHMEYTVIGDTVNTAFRVESMTKSNPNSILITEDTWKVVNHVVKAQQSIPLVMDGKSEPIPLYEVTGRRESNVKPIRKGLDFS